MGVRCPYATSTLFPLYTLRLPQKYEYTFWNWNNCVLFVTVTKIVIFHKHIFTKFSVGTLGVVDSIWHEFQKIWTTLYFTHPPFDCHRSAFLINYVLFVAVMKIAIIQNMREIFTMFCGCFCPTWHYFRNILLARKRIQNFWQQSWYNLPYALTLNWLFYGNVIVLYCHLLSL